MWNEDRWWTVIGFYEETRQNFTDFVEADSPWEAAKVVSEDHVGEQLYIVSVVEGKHEDKLEAEHVQDADALAGY